MKIAIMQPYFLPYLGYFALIKHTDQWVVFDTPQFMRHSWIERNRILKPSDGWQYIRIPLVKHKREIAIKDIRIHQNIEWHKKILAQLEHYKKNAPYYYNVIELLNKIVTYDTDSIVEMNINALVVVCSYLKINFQYKLFSEFSDKIKNVKSPDDWAFKISKYFGANEYYNLPGGIKFFNRAKFNQHHIKLNFLNLNIREYDQKRNIFEPGLSIIDVMMFNTPEEIIDMLNTYKLK